MSQKDPVLGAKVREHLESLGLETPLIKEAVAVPANEKKQIIEEHMAVIMKTLGLNLDDDSLIETPKRIAKMYVDEFFKGLDYANFPKCTTVENKMSAEGEFVAIKNIRVVSMCEHHFLPFFNMNGKGGGVIAYIPGENVLGLSKANRILDFFASRPQVQERLTNQVFEALKVIMNTENVAVYIDTTHTCMSLRGAKDPFAATVTAALGGKFKTDEHIRKEFLEVARSAFI